MNSYDLYSSRLCYERPFCHSFLLNMWMKFCAVVIQIPEFKLYPWNFWQFCISESVPYGGPQLSRQNQKPHAKTKTLRQNQKPHGKSNYPRQNQSYFVVALKYLILPWGFWFCRDVFVFAVRFLVLPWQLWATIVPCSIPRIFLAKRNLNFLLICSATIGEVEGKTATTPLSHHFPTNFVALKKIIFLFLNT